MCKKISEYRQTTLPDHHLRNTALSSSSHTSNIDSGSDPLPSSKPLTISAEEAEIIPVLSGTEAETDSAQGNSVKERC
ncbi:hypothetical protein F2Q68_00018529 [Brassica cretica]|uniref:Uncharacterized protein n=2 Tax=Brassica cretica TaxID=69181 RepID=A0ABQ7CP89_BRACR|nr:hypothetical protein F2Q68_00018529 [Brassica cretica]KAF3561174.1 hypothetical protein DY000_02010746 [Brassica cretica]